MNDIKDRDVDSDYSIVFRMSATMTEQGVRYYPIHKIKYKKSIDQSRKEMVRMLPVRIERELQEIQDFVSSIYDSVMLVKMEYTYFGPYKIEYESLNLTVQGYVFTRGDLTKDGSLFSRGNIFILESSPFIWRDLSRNKMTPNNVKLLSKIPYVD